jgi:hypothetical protein
MDPREQEGEEHPVSRCGDDGACGNHARGGDSDSPDGAAQDGAQRPGKRSGSGPTSMAKKRRVEASAERGCEADAAARRGEEALFAAERDGAGQHSDNFAEYLALCREQSRERASLMAAVRESQEQTRAITQQNVELVETINGLLAVMKNNRAVSDNPSLVGGRSVPEMVMVGFCSGLFFFFSRTVLFWGFFFLVPNRLFSAV